MDQAPPPKPAEYAETQIIDAILGGIFPIGAALPAERELAGRLGVTRTTLREALQRLARDGWIQIRQGKATRVCDYWRDGNLGVLGALAHRPWAAPDDFIPNLLAVRLALAPIYTRAAVENDPPGVLKLLEPANRLPSPPAAASAFAELDWRLHHGLTLLSGNPIYTLILNGFCELYIPLAQSYFQSPPARSASLDFYADLRSAAHAADASAAEAAARRAMSISLRLWNQAAHETGDTTGLHSQAATGPNPYKEG